jgi:predicted peptidase
LGVFALVTAIVYLAVRWGPGALVYQSHALGSTSAPYGFVELVPPAEGPRPLVLVLHGSSGVGDGQLPLRIVAQAPLRRLAIWKLTRHRSAAFDEGALIVAPQSTGQWDVAELDRFLTWLLANRPIDPNRVYLVGSSMGGCGAWRYAAAHPERLTAAMPVSGSCPANGALAEGLKELPIHALHAWDDDVVPNYFSATWVATIAQLRGSPAVEPMKSYPRETDATFDGTTGEWHPGTIPQSHLSLTEYWTGGHGVFGRVYEDEANWLWLLGHRSVRSKN